MQVVALSGSPSRPSRSSWLLHLAATQLEAAGAAPVQWVEVRDLPPVALLSADADAAPLRRALQAVAAADVVLIATPIYTAAYSGLLKLFLDLLPADGLRGKTVLPLATGGSPGHLLALDYALRPVLTALGARHILDSVYAVDTQLALQAPGVWLADHGLQERLTRALAPLQPRDAVTA